MFDGGLMLLNRNPLTAQVYTTIYHHMVGTWIFRVHELLPLLSSLVVSQD